MSQRVRVAVLAGGRSSEHEISLASARSVLEALDPERYETTTIEIGRDGRWALDGRPARELSRSRRGGDAARPRRLDAGRGARRGRRRPADPARAVRRGRDGAGPARARRRPLRRRRRRRLGALHGQGPVQGGAARPRHPGRAQRRRCGSATRSQNPFGYPVFVKPARLGSSVGISKAHDEAELEAAVALARRHDEKVLVEEFVAGIEVECGVLGNRPSPIASVVGRDRRRTPTGTTTRRSTTRAAWTSSSPPGSPDETDRARRRRSPSTSFVATECEGMARVDFFVRDGRRGRRQRAQHDPGLHLDERLREALRGVRDPLRASCSTA